MKDFVHKLINGQDAVIKADDEGYVVKHVIEICHRKKVPCSTSISSQKFDTYYMGEPVKIPFELPVLILNISNFSYDIRLSEDLENVVANRIR